MSTASDASGRTRPPSPAASRNRWIACAFRVLPREPDADVDRLHLARRRFFRRGAPRCRDRRTAERPRFEDLRISGFEDFIEVIWNAQLNCDQILKSSNPQISTYYVFRHQANRVLLRPPAARLRRHLQASARPQRGGRDRGAHRHASTPRNMVCDFSDIKRIVKGWIDRELDHKMVLRHDDPLVDAARRRSASRSTCSTATRRWSGSRG